MKGEPEAARLFSREDLLPSVGAGGGRFADASRSRIVSVDVDYEQGHEITTGRLRAKLQCAASELAQACDPQEWARSSPFFSETYKVIKTPRGYERDPSAPRPGTPWKGLLYEHFAWRAGPFRAAWFRNILNIDYEVASALLHLRYSLHRPLGGGVWFSSASLGVDVDSGHLVAQETETGLAVEIVKRVRFIELGALRDDRGASKLLNREAPQLLGLWLERASPWLDPALSKKVGERRPER